MSQCTGGEHPRAYTCSGKKEPSFRLQKRLVVWKGYVLRVGSDMAISLGKDACTLHIA